MSAAGQQAFDEVCLGRDVAFEVNMVVGRQRDTACVRVLLSGLSARASRRVGAGGCRRFLRRRFR